MFAGSCGVAVAFGAGPPAGVAVFALVLLARPVVDRARNARLDARRSGPDRTPLEGAGMLTGATAGSLLAALALPELMVTMTAVTLPAVIIVLSGEQTPWLAHVRARRLQHPWAWGAMSGALTVAGPTQRARIGPMVTPLARRRPEGGGSGSGHRRPVLGRAARPRRRARQPAAGVHLLRRLRRPVAASRPSRRGARRRPWPLAGRAVRHAGAHFTVRDAQSCPRRTIPVWTACTTPHRAPLRRATRVEGVVLSNTTPEGGIDPVAAADVRAAAGGIRQRRGDLHAFDVAVLSPAVLDGADLAAYAGAGATWVVVTGWIDALPDVIDAGPPR